MYVLLIVVDERDHIVPIRVAPICIQVFVFLRTIEVLFGCPWVQLLLVGGWDLVVVLGLGLGWEELFPESELLSRWGAPIVDITVWVPDLVVPGVTAMGSLWA